MDLEFAKDAETMNLNLCKSLIDEIKSLSAEELTHCLLDSYIKRGENKADFYIHAHLCFKL